MINPEAKINRNIFKDGVEQVPNRDGFGKALLELGEKDKNVVVLCADLAESTRVQWFREKFPDRYIEMGVAEQNLASVASGLANYGKIPFIASYAMFSPGRNWEQIRTTIALPNLPVKIVGAHAGVSVGPDGATHQALEDLAIMRVLPNMTVVVPADSEEARKATLAIYSVKGPSYIRLAREKTPVITTENSPFVIGFANTLMDREEIDVAIIACGPLVYEALVAGEELSTEGINVAVINNHTIKPIDRKNIIFYAKKAGAVVVVEEHQSAGGLGGAVAEVLSEEYPVPIEFVGVKNRFGQSGAPDELLKEYKLKSKNIEDAVRKVLKRK
ncbi:MAG: transketolase C-terminal domain-containing protein [Patescibacteria group bacterium]